MSSAARPRVTTKSHLNKVCVMSVSCLVSRRSRCQGHNSSRPTVRLHDRQCAVCAPARTAHAQPANKRAPACVVSFVSPTRGQSRDVLCHTAPSTSARRLSRAPCHLLPCPARVDRRLPALPWSVWAAAGTEEGGVGGETCPSTAPSPVPAQLRTLLPQNSAPLTFSTVLT